MDVSELLAQLSREMGEKEFSREELLGRLFSVSEELRELATQRDTVEKLRRRFAAEPVVDAAVDDGGAPPALDADGSRRTLDVAWPVGPHYHKQFKSKKRQSWARYKLGTADWYIATLQQIEATVPKLDRLVGVEMAIDGAIQALCATFEAAVYALTTALEAGASLPRDHRTPSHRATWSNLVDQAERHSVELECEPKVVSGLLGVDTDAPEGWLAQLLMLRRRAAQHDLLIRHWLVGGADAVVYIDVPGAGPQPPLDYLTAARDRVEDLLETMLDDQELVRRGRIYPIERLQPSVDRDLPDLLRRAQVTP